MATQPPSNQIPFSPLFPHSRANVTPDEVARALGISGQQVRDLLDAGEFAAVPINDQAAVREHVRIWRPSVEAWWLERFEQKNGCSAPFIQSPEVQNWRAHLRARTTPSARKL